MNAPTLTSADRVAPTVAGPALDTCLEVYRRHLHLPDDGAVLFTLGAVAANLLPGDPVWALTVGPPGGGKTETIGPVGALPYVHVASTLTEPALLSGSPKREREKDANGGLLRKLGPFGILLVRDFSGVLSMNRDGRAQLLAALREIYDGQWTRYVGTGGGRELAWTGKAGLVGAVTPSIDRHHTVMGALGERFVLYRLRVEDTNEQARRRLGNRSGEQLMRADLANAVARLFATLDFDREQRPLTDTEVDWLVGLASFTVRARTAVERDGYTREVEVMPEAEAPARLVGTLAQLLAGLEAVGVNIARAQQIVAKVAADCIPSVRYRIITELHDHGPQHTARLTEATGIPKTTAERALEDLSLLGLVDAGRAADHATAAKRWCLSDDAAAAWPASPESTERSL